MKLINIVKSAYRYARGKHLIKMLVGVYTAPETSFLAEVSEGNPGLLIVFFDTLFDDMQGWNLRGDVLVVLKGCTFKDCEPPKSDKILVIK